MPFMFTVDVVSTHSRPKAAGAALSNSICMVSGFNTQPPEGGWVYTFTLLIAFPKFQHTAARRRLAGKTTTCSPSFSVSTHSRPKAAGLSIDTAAIFIPVSTHSRPKAAGCLQRSSIGVRQFQHTAARRRLGGRRQLPLRPAQGFNTQPPEGGWALDLLSALSLNGFNTQPPEGGWSRDSVRHCKAKSFQHTAARRRLAIYIVLYSTILMFQHTAARRRLGIKSGYSPVEFSVSTHSRPKAAGMFKTSVISTSPEFQHTAARRRLGLLKTV